MNPWILFGLIGLVAVYFVDYLIRRKKWNENTKEEKISLAIHMITLGVYIFLSALGLLWGITESRADTAFGHMLYNITKKLVSLNGIVALIAVIGAFVLRKKERTKGSILIHIGALGYMLAMFAISVLAGLM